jgi:hypothetical protein
MLRLIVGDGALLGADDIQITVNPAATSLTFAPSADAYINPSSPTKNYGTANTPQVRNKSSQQYNAYLKFNVTVVSGTITSAKIRLYVTDASKSGGSIYSVSNTNWIESAINASNAPASNATALQTLGAVTKTWVEFNVTAAVTGNGVVSFALKTTSTDSVYYSSKEGTNPPQLVITTGGTVTAASSEHTEVSTLSVESGFTPRLYLPIIGNN